MGIEANLWRQETPGNAGWKQSARPAAADKYLMVSCDAHVNEPAGFTENLPEHLKIALPRIEVDENGQKWMIVGDRREKAVMTDAADEGDDEDRERIRSARSPDQIIENMDRDGVDIQISFPNKGIYTFSLNNNDIMYPVASAYNDWQAQYFRDIKDRLLPMAMIITQDVDRAVAEVERISKMDFFRGVMLPNKVVYGPYGAQNKGYNHLDYDRLWACLQDKNLAITFHCATGYDPRAIRGPGATMTAYVAHSHPTVIEAVSHMCAGGIIERFPKLRFATIESGIGYLPWSLTAMDEAYKKHHLWIKHKLKKLPSEYYMDNGFASFQEEPSGLELIDPRLQGATWQGLERCFMWANDYPHHEGSWPHSSQAIERQMQHLSERQRRLVLGENAVRCFAIEDLAAKRRTKAQIDALKQQAAAE